MSQEIKSKTSEEQAREAIEKVVDSVISDAIKDQQPLTKQQKKELQIIRNTKIEELTQKELEKSKGLLQLFNNENLYSKDPQNVTLFPERIENLKQIGEIEKKIKEDIKSDNAFLDSLKTKSAPLQRSKSDNLFARINKTKDLRRAKSLDDLMPQTTLIEYTSTKINSILDYFLEEYYNAKYRDKDVPDKVAYAKDKDKKDYNLIKEALRSKLESIGFTQDLDKIYRDLSEKKFSYNESEIRSHKIAEDFSAQLKNAVQNPEIKSAEDFIKSVSDSLETWKQNKTTISVENSLKSDLELGIEKFKKNLSANLYKATLHGLLTINDKGNEEIEKGKKEGRVIATMDQTKSFLEEKFGTLQFRDADKAKIDAVTQGILASLSNLIKMQEDIEANLKKAERLYPKGSNQYKSIEENLQTSFKKGLEEYIKHFSELIQSSNKKEEFTSSISESLKKLEQDKQSITDIKEKEKELEKLAKLKEAVEPLLESIKGKKQDIIDQNLEKIRKSPPSEPLPQIPNRTNKLETQNAEKRLAISPEEQKESLIQENKKWLESAKKIDFSSKENFSTWKEEALKRKKEANEVKTR